MLKMKNKFIIILLFVFLVGCDSIRNTNRTSLDYKKSESELYNQGYQKFKKKRYKEAVVDFEAVKSLYPYSNLAQKSILHLIDIYDHEKKYDDALILLDELMEEYDKYSHDEEIHYRYAIIFYKNIQNQLRNQDLIIKSGKIFTAFLQNFPRSVHYGEVEEKLSIINGRMIYKEMEVGYFYEKNRNFVSALKRYMNAYQYGGNNKYFAELLYRIYYCYSMIKMDGEGEFYFQKLKKDFSETKWYSFALKLQKN